MHLPVAVAVPIFACMIGGLPVRPAAIAPEDGALADGALLQAAGDKPEPATSDRARVAPGPSERNEPAAPEIRQTPAGGQTSGGTQGKPDAAEQGKHND